MITSKYVSMHLHTAQNDDHVWEVTAGAVLFSGRHASLQFHQVPTSILSALKPNPEGYIEFSCHVSSVSFNLKQILRFSLSFMLVVLLKRTNRHQELRDV